VVHLTQSSNIFKIILTLEIQQMVSFNFTNCVPMWQSVTSLGPWFKFLGLVGFWFWPKCLMASIQL
jgi:hypothetical protein